MRTIAWINHPGPNANSLREIVGDCYNSSARRMEGVSGISELNLLFNWRA